MGEPAIAQVTQELGHGWQMAVDGGGPEALSQCFFIVSATFVASRFWGEC